MNSVRAQLRKLPPKAVIKLLKKVFAMPAPAARLILNDITKARKAHQPWIHRVKLNPNVHQDWSGCWIGENIQKLNEEELLKRVHDADIVMFYVHGGGFRIGSCTMYMDTNIAWIIALKEKYGLHCMIMSIDYRLAPEYKYPSPVEDVVRAYEHLVQKLCVDSEKIIVVGDSAGSALILEMLFITHDPSMFEIVIEDETGEGGGQPILNELPRPAGTVLISPLVTNETNSESWKNNQKLDYITEYTAKVITKDYFHSSKTKHPEEDEEDLKSQQILGIAKLQTGFQAFMSPEVLMYVGNFEVLRDDALQLAMKAEQDGVVWQTVIEDNVHDWFCVREVVKNKETIKRADDTFADFCYRAIGGTTTNQNTLATSSYVLSAPIRENSQLEAVKEEDEDEAISSDDDSTFQSDTTPSTSSIYDEFRLSKLSIFDRLNNSESNSSTQSSTKRLPSDQSPTRTTSTSKRSSDIVFV